MSKLAFNRTVVGYNRYIYPARWLSFHPNANILVRVLINIIPKGRKK